MTGPIFNAGAIEATASIDRSQFIRDLREMQADIAAFQRNGINIGVSIDKEKVKAELRALTQELSTGNNAIKLTLGLDTTQARRDYDAFKASMGDASSSINIKGDTTDIKAKAVEATGILRAVPNSTTTRLTGDSSSLDIKIAQAVIKLQELQDKKASPELDLKIATFTAQRDQAVTKLAELQRMNVTPKVSVDLIALFADLGKARADLDELNARRASPKIVLEIAAEEAKLQQFRVHLDELGSQRVNPEVDLLTQKSQEALDRTNRQIDVLSRREATPEITASIEKFQDKAKSIEDTIARLSELRATPKLDADIAALEAKIALGEERVRTLDAMKANPKLDAQADVLESKIDKIVERIHILDAQKSNSKLDADISAALAKVDTLDQRIRDTERQKGSAKLDVDIVAAEANISALEARRDAFNAKEAKIKATADTANAVVGMDYVEAKRCALDGSSATVDVRMGRDSGRSNLIIAGIAAALAAVTYAAPAAAAGIAGVTGAAAVGIQAYGALALGLNGIATAYQAMATQAQQGAVQQNVSHTGVESALRSLDNARASSVRSAENAADAVTQAETSAARQQVTSFETIANAKETLARTLITNSKSISDAQYNEAHTFETSARSIQTAEQTLANAQVSAAIAVTALNDARQQEIFTLEDLQLKLRGASLTEDEAATALKQAVEHLRVLTRDPLATPLQLEQANEAIKRAQLTVDESKQSYTETKAAADEAAQTGVEGSQSVVAAQRQVTLANQQVADSAKNLQQVQEDTAHANEQAILNTAKAIDDAQYANQKATEAVTKAVSDGQYAQSQAANAVTKAIEAQKDNQVQSAQAILDALARVSDAQETAANEGTKAFNRVQYAMSLLSPEGQKFALFLYNDMRPAVNSVSDAIDKNMLPKFQDSLQRLLGLVPELKVGLGETGTVFGDLAEESSKMATSPAFKTEFATILHGNNLMISDLGRSGLLLGDSFTTMYTASLPLLENFTLWTNKSALLFDTWIKGKTTSGEFATFMQLAGDRAKELWNFLVQLAHTALDLGIALAPVGQTLFGIADALLKVLDWVSRVNPEVIQFTAYATALYFAITNLGKGVLGLLTIFNTGEGRFAKIGVAMENAALSAGIYTEKLVGTVASSETAAVAGEKVATAGSKVSSAIGKMGTALPIVGAALIGFTALWDANVISTDKGAEALLKGGKAADDMRTALDKQSHTFESSNSTIAGFNKSVSDITGGFSNWGVDLIQHFIPSLSDATKKAQDMRDAMDPLTRAQQDATTAQNDYSNAVNRFGPNSAEALDAQQRWQDATKESTRQQDLMRAGLVSATDALIAQRDEMLGNLNAEIRFKDDLANVTKGIIEHGKSVDLDTDAGRRNVEQLNNMSAAAIDNLTQMQKNGATAQDVAIKEDYYKNALYNTAIQIGYTKDQAQRYVDQLHLVPNDVNTNVGLNIGDAARTLQGYVNNIAWLRNLGPIQTVLNLQQQISGIVNAPPRAQGSIDFIRPQIAMATGMADGGMLDVRGKAMVSNLAAIVKPNTPTLVGDNKQFNESYIPLDPSSARSQAIFDLTAKALNRIVLPQGSTGNTSATSPTTSNFKTSLADQKAYNKTFGTDSTTSNNANSSSNDKSNGNSVHSNATTEVTQNNGSSGSDSPTIGTVVMQIPYGATPQEYVEHLDFALQYHRKKGVYKR